MISVQLTGASQARLRSLEKRFPRTMRAAFGAAATRARKRFQKLMRAGGGMYGVSQLAPHHSISTYLRPGQKMGGVLADPARIVMFKRSPDEQVIGWPDALAKWAVRFQESNTHAMTQGERGYLHWRGVRDIPSTYSRPERDVVNSFAADLTREWPGMVNAMFEKYYMSRRAKYGAGGIK